MKNIRQLDERGEPFQPTMPARKSQDLDRRLVPNVRTLLLTLLLRKPELSIMSRAVRVGGDRDGKSVGVER